MDNFTGQALEAPADDLRRSGLALTASARRRVAQPLEVNPVHAQWLLNIIEQRLLTVLPGGMHGGSAHLAERSQPPDGLL